jgi:hypothetical protein
MDAIQLGADLNRISALGFVISIGVYLVASGRRPRAVELVALYGIGIPSCLSYLYSIHHALSHDWYDAPTLPWWHGSGGWITCSVAMLAYLYLLTADTREALLQQDIDD